MKNTILQLATTKFSNFFDRFIHEDVSSDELFIARVLTGISFLAAITTLGLVTFLNGNYTTAYNNSLLIFSGTSACLVYLGKKNIFSLKGRLNVFCITLTLLIGVLTYLQYSFLPSTTVWFPPLTFSLVLLVGLKMGIILGASLTIFYLYIAIDTYHLKLFIPKMYQNFDSYQLEIVANVFIATIIGSVVAYIYEINRVIYLRKEKESQKLILEQRDLINKNSRLTELGVLAGGVAHEINNPLTIILGLTEVIKMHGSENPIIVEKTDKIMEAASRAQNIVKGLEEYTLESKQNERDQIYLKTFFSTLADKYNNETLPNIEFQFPNIEDDQKIFFSKRSLFKIFTILIENSIYELSKSKLEQTIEIKYTKNSPQIHKFTVLDSGKGISENISSKVFSPFFTTKPVGEGTGLGLSIAKRIIETNPDNSIYIDHSQKMPGISFLISTAD